MPLREMTRAQLAVLWLWARLASSDTYVHVVPSTVLEYPELRIVTAGIN